MVIVALFFVYAENTWRTMYAVPCFCCYGNSHAGNCACSRCPPTTCFWCVTWNIAAVRVGTGLACYTSSGVNRTFLQAARHVRCIFIMGTVASLLYCQQGVCCVMNTCYYFSVPARAMRIAAVSNLDSKWLRCTFFLLSFCLFVITTSISGSRAGCKRV